MTTGLSSSHVLHSGKPMTWTNRMQLYQILFLYHERRTISNLNKGDNFPATPQHPSGIFQLAPA